MSSCSLFARSSLFATLAAVAASACAVDPAADEAPAESVAALASTPVQNINTAEASFRGTVQSNVTASATSAGLSLSSTGLSIVHVPRNRTIASGRTTAGTQALFLSRAVRRASGGTFDPGLYELVPSATGASLYRYDAAGRIAVPPPAPAPFHTSLGDDMCENAPDLIMEFCQSFVACAAYDLWC